MTFVCGKRFSIGLFDVLFRTPKQKFIESLVTKHKPRVYLTRYALNGIQRVKFKPKLNHERDLKTATELPMMQNKHSSQNTVGPSLKHNTPSTKHAVLMRLSKNLGSTSRIILVDRIFIGYGVVIGLSFLVLCMFSWAIKNQINQTHIRLLEESSRIDKNKATISSALNNVEKTIHNHNEWMISLIDLLSEHKILNSNLYTIKSFSLEPNRCRFLISIPKKNYETYLRQLVELKQKIAGNISAFPTLFNQTIELHVDISRDDK